MDREKHGHCLRVNKDKNVDAECRKLDFYEKVFMIFLIFSGILFISTPAIFIPLVQEEEIELRVVMYFFCMLLLSYGVFLIVSSIQCIKRRI